MVDAGGELVDLLRGDPEVVAPARSVVPWTEWQSPTVRIELASAAAQHSIAIGLT